MKCINPNEIYESYMDLLGQATKCWVDSPEPIYVYIYMYTHIHAYIYISIYPVPSENQLRHLLQKLLPLTVLSECVESTVNCGEFGLSLQHFYILSHLYKPLKTDTPK